MLWRTQTGHQTCLARLLRPRPTLLTHLLLLPSLTLSQLRWVKPVLPHQTFGIMRNRLPCKTVMCLWPSGKMCDRLALWKTSFRYRVYVRAWCRLAVSVGSGSPQPMGCANTCVLHMLPFG